jgi:hypothetical protein
VPSRSWMAGQALPLPVRLAAPGPSSGMPSTRCSASPCSEFADARARELGLGAIRLYTNAAMTENLALYPRRGYVETHRAEADGFSRVYSSTRL